MKPLPMSIKWILLATARILWGYAHGILYIRCSVSVKCADEIAWGYLFYHFISNDPPHYHNLS